MRKFISLLLTLALLATLVPTVFVSAADGEETLTFSITEDASVTFSNNYMGKSVTYGEYQGGEDTSYYLRTVPDTTSKEYAVHKAALTGLKDALGTTKAVTKVEFCTYIVGERTDTNADGSYGLSNTMNIYPAYSGWSESTITYNSWKDNGYAPGLSNPGSSYGIIDSSVTPVTTSYTFPSVAYGAAPVSAVFDATDAFKAAMSSGIDTNSVFSFMTALGEESTSKWGYVIFASSEYTKAEYRPYIKITIDDIPALKAVSKTEPVSPSDDFSLTVSNNIASANISVNGTAVDTADIKISGVNLKFSYDYQPFSTYDVAVNITDSYGQKFSKTYNFTTSYETTVENLTAAEFLYYKIGTQTPVVPSQNSNDVYAYRNSSSTNASNSTIMMRFSLGDKLYDSFVVTYTSKSGIASQRLFKFDNVTDSAGADIVYDNLTATLYDESNLLGTPVANDKVGSLDVADYANERIKAGKDYMCILITAAFGNTTTINKNIIPTAVAEYNKNPSITISDKDIHLAGTTLSSATISLITSLPAAFAEKVELVDEEGLKVDSAAFSCSGGSITLDAPVTLASDSEYSIIIRSGAEDGNGNTLTSELVVQSFFTCSEVTYGADEQSRHELYTDNTNQTVEYLYINPDFGGMQYSVVISKEADDSVVYSDGLKSTLGGKVEGTLELGASGEYTLTIVPMGAQSGWQQSFYIFTESELDALWTILTTSTDYEDLSDNWSECVSAFGITKAANTNLTVLCKVLAANVKDFGARTNSNFNKFKSHLATCEILAQLNQSEMLSVGEAKSLLESSFPQVESADSAAYAKISADWAELGTKITKEYQKSADTVFTASAEAAVLLTSIDTVKKQDTLDKLNALNHTSLIYDFVTSDGNAGYLGITDLVDDYKALSSTSTVDSAVQGKGFATAELFKAAFKAAIETAQLNPPADNSNKNPSYSSGGGGGFGVISSNPATIPEVSVPETGVALPFDDIAHHTWAHSAIATLSQKGIISGRGDGVFAPDDNVTRAEFAKMLVLALSVADNGTQVTFTDVTSDDWFSTYANIAAANGIVLGADGCFMPHNNITRQDAAVMIHRASSLTGGSMPAFSDGDTIASYAREAVAALCTSGIIKGMDDGSFAPLSGLTRAQAAVMLARIMEVK